MQETSWTFIKGSLAMFVICCVLRVLYKFSRGGSFFGGYCWIFTWCDTKLLAVQMMGFSLVSEQFTCCLLTAQPQQVGRVSRKRGIGHCWILDFPARISQRWDRERKLEKLLGSGGKQQHCTHWVLQWGLIPERPALKKKWLAKKWKN